MVILTILAWEIKFMETIALTKAKARLSGLIGRLMHRKEPIVITRHGKPVAALVAYDQWERQAAGTTCGLGSVAPPPGNLDAEIDAMVEEIYEARTKSKARQPAF